MDRIIRIEIVYEPIHSTFSWIKNHASRKHQGSAMLKQNPLAAFVVIVTAGNVNAA
jgi:hypothetical protein